MPRFKKVRSQRSAELVKLTQIATTVAVVVVVLAAGAAVVPGVEMFLAQARAQVSLFTGRDLGAETLRGFVAGSIEALGDRGDP